MSKNLTQLLADSRVMLDGVDGKAMTEQEKLLLALTKVVENANKIDSHIENLDESEKIEYFKQLGEKDGINYNEIMAKGIPNTVSEIISGIDTALVEQVILNISMEYPLMNTVKEEKVRNGIKQMFYQDMKQTGNKSGFSPVEIKDYNQGRAPIFSETIKATTEISAGYDILSEMLNDITIKQSLFVALVNDYIYAIARPLAQKNYARLLSMLDNKDNFQQVLEFTKTTDEVKNPQVKINAKELAEFVISAKTPNRKMLTKKPKGATTNLQYKFDPKNAVVIMNRDYATNYTFDLKAGTFNMGEVSMPFGDIIVLDFDILNDSIDGTSTNFLKDSEVLIIEKDAFWDIVHFTGSKTIDTPKLKMVRNEYTRRTMFLKKTALTVRFKLGT